MPIRIPNDLPARRTLDSEGVMVMTEASAARQDIRPLKIGLLNLMPNKIKTETQFARLIGATPLQVELTLVKITSHTPKNASPEPRGVMKNMPPDPVAFTPNCVRSVSR